MSSHSPASLWNHRYLAYCRAQGNPPEAQDVIDIERFPGGKMSGYILWVNQQLVAARAEHPEFFAGHTLLDHDGFDRWLDSRTHSPAFLNFMAEWCRILHVQSAPKVSTFNPIHEFTDAHLASCQRCRREVELTNAD